MADQLGNKSGLTLSLCIGSLTSGIGSANYVASSKSLIFASDFAASHVDTYRHELFHAYQDNVGYSGGIGSYGLGQAGFVNIEFEQAVFKDIMNGYATALGQFADADIREDYIEWIISLTNNATAYPNVVSITDFETKYFQFLTEFNNSDPIYGGGTIIQSLKPNALKKIFDGLQKGGCGL